MGASRVALGWRCGWCFRKISHGLHGFNGFQSVESAESVANSLVAFYEDLQAKPGWDHRALRSGGVADGVLEKSATDCTDLTDFNPLNPRLVPLQRSSKTFKILHQRAAQPNFACFIQQHKVSRGSSKKF